MNGTRLVNYVFSASQENKNTIVTSVGQSMRAKRPRFPQNNTNHTINVQPALLDWIPRLAADIKPASWLKYVCSSGPKPTLTKGFTVSFSE